MPERLVDLDRSAYLYPLPESARTSREATIFDAYNAGASVSALVRRWHIAPAHLARVLRLDPTGEAAVIAEANAAFTRLRDAITDASCD